MLNWLQSAFDWLLSAPKVLNSVVAIGAIGGVASAGILLVTAQPPPGIAEPTEKVTGQAGSPVDARWYKVEVDYPSRLVVGQEGLVVVTVTVHSSSPDDLVSVSLASQSFSVAPTSEVLLREGTTRFIIKAVESGGKYILINDSLKSRTDAGFQQNPRGAAFGDPRALLIVVDEREFVGVPYRTWSAIGSGAATVSGIIGVPALILLLIGRYWPERRDKRTGPWTPPKDPPEDRNRPRKK